MAATHLWQGSVRFALVTFSRKSSSVYICPTEVRSSAFCWKNFRERSQCERHTKSKEQYSLFNRRRLRSHFSLLWPPLCFSHRPTSGAFTTSPSFWPRVLVNPQHLLNETVLWPFILASFSHSTWLSSWFSATSVFLSSSFWRFCVCLTLVSLRYHRQPCNQYCQPEWSVATDHSSINVSPICPTWQRAVSIELAMPSP